MLPTSHKLVITSQELVPVELCNGILTNRHDLQITHEEADVIIVQQMTKAAQGGANNINVICDDTDVFILLVHYYAN